MVVCWADLEAMQQCQRLIPDGEDNGLVGTVHGHIMAGPQDTAMPLAHYQAAARHACQGRNSLVVGFPRSSPSRIKGQIVHLQYNIS